MAGKAWQSKGCGTCKKRKIKCDEGKPQCGQCVKRGVQCPGYEKTRFFVFQEPKNQQQEQSQGPSGRRDSLPLGRSSQFIFEEPAGTQSTKSERPERPQRLEKPEKTESSRQQISRRKHSARAPGPIQNVGSASMMRNQMFYSFFNIYFPNNSCASSNVDLWNYVVTGVSAQPTKTLMLEKAISALSCLHIGKAYRNKSIFNYGLELYNGSIRHMADMIGRGRFHEDIIYTGVIFQDIETFHSPFGFETWLAHIQGVNSILRHYHPQISDNPLLAAIYSQHQTTKEVVSWSMHMMPGEKIRWGTRPTEGGPMVDLIDVFVELSEISVDIDSVDATDQDDLQALLSKCLALESKQMRWYACNILHLGKGPVICEPGELETRIPPVDDIFGPAYRFPSLDDCRLHQVFWMTLSFLYSFIHRIRTIAASNTPWGALAFPNPNQDQNSDLPSVYADKIARTLPYCLQNSMNLWGVCFAVVSIGHISQTFIRTRNLEKFLYTQNVLSLYGDNCFDFCLHLHGYLQHAWTSASQKSGDIFPEPTEYSSSGSSDGGSPAAVWKV